MSHYETLGLDSTATPEQIKAAYKKEAMKHHPDRGGDVSTFQKIQKAYDVLGDETRKQHYDATGEDSEAPDRNLLDLQILANLFTQVISQIGNVEYQDLVVMMNDNLQNEITRANKAINDQRTHIEKLQKVILRLSVPEGKRNLLAEIAEGQIDQCTRSITEIANSLETVIRVRELLNEIEYRTDEQPETGFKVNRAFQPNFPSEEEFAEMLKRAHGG